jgi:hypothetical protein
MRKVAKLVYITMATRVIVDEDAQDDEIIEASRKNFILKVKEELHENLEDIVDDIECPYDENSDN